MSIPNFFHILKENGNVCHLKRKLKCGKAKKFKYKFKKQKSVFNSHIFVAVLF